MEKPRLAKPLVALCLFTLAACNTLPSEEIEEESPEYATAAGGWTGVQIGGGQGTDTVAGTVHTLKVNTWDIYGTSDSMYFVQQVVSGDTSITVRVASFDGPDPTGKAVVMIREDLGTGSRFVASELTPVASNGFRQHYRATTGGTAKMNKYAASKIGALLRVVRKGNAFTTFYQTGSTWTQMGSAITLSNLGKAVYVGFGVASHTDGPIATVVFDKIALSGGTILTCVPKSTSCDGNKTRTCSTSGTWQAGTTCPLVCSAAKCAGVCKPGARRCNANGNVDYCMDNGTWLDAETCVNGLCSGGACTPCTLNQTGCDGPTLLVCDGNAQWHATGCGAQCHSDSCGRSWCFSDSSNYCVIDVDNPPDSAALCGLADMGGFPCVANPIGTWCQAGIQTYLYQYVLGAPFTYSLDTQRYYVCDGGKWQLGS